MRTGTSNYKTVSKMMWSMALLLVVFTAGCDRDHGAVPLVSSGPTVIYTVPLDGSTGVPVNRKISAAFSEPMDLTTVTAPGTFTLRETVLGTAVTGTVTYDEASRIALLSPGSLLKNNTQYTGTITTAANSVANKALASNYVWTFTTGAASDVTAPKILSTAPTDTATNVPLNQIITATFNEPMDPLTITLATFTVTGPSGNVLGTVNLVGTTASFTPTGGLTSGATYTAEIAASDLAGNPWVSGNVPNPWSFTVAAALHLGPAPVILGATEPYGVLSNTGVTLGGGGVTGNRVVGDVGIFPAGACVGCTVGATNAITGVLENGTVPASDAMVALTAAYNDAIGRTTNVCTLIASGDLTANPSAACGGSANGTYAPGLYWSATSMAIPVGGTITLDGQNDPTAVFIFQSESTINSIGGDTHVVLINQAQAKNVFWVAKSSATIGGTTSDFKGTVIALVAITVNTGTDMEGRALARGAEVTVQDGAKITVPAP